MRKKNVLNIYNTLINITRSGIKGSFADEPVRKTVVINLFSFVGIFFMFFFGIKTFSENLFIHASILFISAVFVLVNFIFLQITKNYKIAGVFIVILMLILQLYFLIASTESEDLYFWYYTYPILSIFTLNGKKGSLFTFILFAITIILFCWQPDFMFEYKHNFKIRFMATNITVYLLAIVFERVRDKTYHNLVKTNKKKSYYLIKVLEQKKQILVQTKQLELTNKELEKLSLVAEKTDNAVVIMDPKGKFEWINKGFTSMYGYKLDEIINKNPNKLIGADANVRIIDLISVWFGDKQPITYEALKKTRSGNEIWTQTTLTPILGDEGRITKLISIDSNITKLKKAQEEIEEKNKDITSSLRYAKRIQVALLPTEQNLKTKFKDAFIYYKPKQIVSGDFYWIATINEIDIIVVADCTGHGVPGALMSMIGISFLNKIILEKKITKPKEILNRLRKNVIQAFHKEEQDFETYDGMDISVITIDKSHGKMIYAGAMNPVYIIRDNKIIELKADRMSIGYSAFKPSAFSQQEFVLSKDDKIYMFTDGYVDQFGGKRDKKFKLHRFRELLATMNDENLAEQKKILNSTIKDWMDDRDQIDDILIIGIKYS